MDANKVIELTLEEMKEIKSGLEAYALKLAEHTNQEGVENKLETIRRILEKLAQ